MAGVLTYARLASRALIALKGEAWRDFLQGLITQDVETLAAGEARFGALLAPQGRLLFDLFVVGREDGCWLDVEAVRGEALIQRLLMYRLRAKVDVAADDTPVAVLFGDGAPGVRWIRDPRAPDLGWRGYGAERPAGATLAGEQDYEEHRLRLGVPGPADWGSDKTYPIEADFDLLHGIDFKKGCFIGQETTSRMKRRGQVKSRMLPIRFEGAAPAPGSEILAGSLRAGEVLSGGTGVAMALVRLDRIEGAQLTVETRAVQVEKPPWFRTGHSQDAA